MSPDQLAQSLQDAAAVADKLAAHETLPVSAELSKYLEGQGLDTAEVRGDSTKVSVTSISRGGPTFARQACGQPSLQLVPWTSPA